MSEVRTEILAYPRVVAKTLKGPSNYSGPIKVIFDELHYIVAAGAYMTGGYIANVEKIDGKIVEIRIYVTGSGAGAPLQEVEAGTDLSAQTLIVFAIGK